MPTIERIPIHRYFAPGHFPARMTATTQFIDADGLVMIDGVAYTKG